jgi:D-sedoheptulose 7-phosphate isomerase
VKNSFFKKIIRTRIQDIVKNFNKLAYLDSEISKSAGLMLKVLNKNKILFCGNGGSASDSMHVTAELIGRYLKKKRIPLAAIALSSNVSIITAVANDFSFREVFSRQVEALGKKGDMLFAISTSGRSPNILEALRVAKKKGMKTILLTGKNKINYKYLDLFIKVPALRVDRIQELHIAVLHIICELIESKF